jgi:hypothetical protein
MLAPTDLTRWWGVGMLSMTVKCETVIESVSLPRRVARNWGTTFIAVVSNIFIDTLLEKGYV